MSEKYIRKSIPFNPECKEDMELYEKLKKLPYGEFTQITKEMWIERLRAAN